MATGKELSSWVTCHGEGESFFYFSVVLHPIDKEQTNISGFFRTSFFMFVSMQCTQHYSYTRSVHPSPICPLLQVLTVCNGKASFHSKMLGKYRKKKACLSSWPFVIRSSVNFLNRPGNSFIRSCSNSHSSIFYVCCGSWGGKTSVGFHQHKKINHLPGFPTRLLYPG